jgi:hypothetical protein
MTSKLHLLNAATAADKAWMAEVSTVFGVQDAGMARFQDRANGEPGTRLRKLYDAYVKARDAYSSETSAGIDWKSKRSPF